MKFDFKNEIDKAVLKITILFQNDKAVFEKFYFHLILIHKFHFFQHFLNFHQN